MNFQLTEEQILIQKMAREFADTELAPGVVERDDKKIWPKEGIAKMAQLGFMGMMTDSKWDGEGMDEKGYDSKTGNLLVAVDPRYFRPTEVETLLGDPSKAKEKLGWEPKITLEEMVHEMMENDINIAKRDSLVKEHGFKAPDFNE